MVKDIDIYDVTSIRSLNDELDKATGAFDRMMLALRVQLNDAVEKSELTRSEVGSILASALPSLFGQSVQFALGKQKAKEEARKIKRSVL